MAGKDCKAYINTGTYGVKVWTEIKRGSEFKLPASRSASEYKMRGFTGTVNATGYIKRAATFKYQAKAAGVADTVFAALQTAFLAGTDIELAFMEKAMAVGAKGVAGFFQISKMDRDEADEENPSYEIECVPADHEETGTVVEVAPYTGV